MKKINLSLIVLAGALSALAFTSTPAAAQGCCGGAAACPVAAADTAAAKPDLLKTCPVSGEKLGEMGDAYTFTYKDQEVKLCCKGCKKDFDKNPDKYIAKIRAADKK